MHSDVSSCPSPQKRKQIYTTQLNDIALLNKSSQSYGVSLCHMGSRSVTFYPTQVNAPRLTPAKQAGIQLIYPAGMEGWVDLYAP